MNAREGLVLGSRLLAIFFFMKAVVLLVNEFVYMASLRLSQYGEQIFYPPHFALPTVYMFAAIFLWWRSPAMAKRTFSNSPALPATTNPGTFARTIAWGLAVYYLVAGIGGITDFAVAKFLNAMSIDMDVVSRGPTWNDMAHSLVWLIAGIVLLLGSARIGRVMRSAGDTVADTLWRITPEDEKKE